MIKRFTTAGLALVLAACAAQAPSPVPVPVAEPLPGRPLQTFPGGEVHMATTRADLIASARALFGDAALDRAAKASSMLIVKRFVGMSPPPPPGAGPDWRPPTPTALLMREGGRWTVAVAGGGWRPAAAERAGEIDAIIALGDFWSEAAFTPACPDYGATNLLLKVPSRAEIVRSAQCTSRTSTLVQAALAA